MKVILFLLLFNAPIVAQSYTITLMGLPFVDVEQTIHDSGKIEFSTQTRGVWDLIWPTQNKYTATYDPETFSILSWQKNIKQGDVKHQLTGKRDFLGYMSYGEEKLVNIQRHTTNIFSLLAMVQHWSYESLDTKKFHLEHEGKIGTARFIWSDSTNAWNGKDSILCDHYRLDLDFTEEKIKFDDSSDYFMKEVASENVVRELYVSRENPKRIIQARLKTNWLPVTATIDTD